MVGTAGGKIRIEIVPWLTQPFGQKGSSRLILEEEIEQELTLLDLLSTLVGRYPAVGETIVDFQAGQLFEHVNVIHNDTLLLSSTALEQRLAGGDLLVFLPAYAGG